MAMQTRATSQTRSRSIREDAVAKPAGDTLEGLWSSSDHSRLSATRNELDGECFCVYSFTDRLVSVRSESVLVDEGATRIEIRAGDDLPRGLIRVLSAVAGIRVSPGGLRSDLTAPSGEYPLAPIRPNLVGAVSEQQLSALLDRARATGDDELPLIIASSLSREVRRALEDRGVSYLDGRGRVHLVAPGLLFHHDAPERQRVESLEPAFSGLGATGVRAVQVLLGNVGREWRVSDLSGDAGISLGYAHKVLEHLEEQGLVTSFGEGPRRRRSIRERGELLNWLLERPAATRIHRRLPVAVYARTLSDLFDRVSRRLAEENVDHAWTGAAGASLLGAGPTSVPRATLRVSPDCLLPRVADLLGAREAGRGANLLLVEDVGSVGVFGATRTADSWMVATPVRVFLDLWGEARGRDAAEHFREVVLGY
jgi:hypothetical protein